MLRVTWTAITLLILMLVINLTSAIASVDSERAQRELKTRVTHAKQVLPKESKLSQRIQEIEKLRDFASSEIEKQRGIKKPDAADNKLLLQLIGLDQDLGSFLDASSKDFSAETCATDRVAIIHSYQGAGTEERTTADLPAHAQDSLDLLNLLCAGN